MKFTAKQYDKLLDTIDPDDIKELWELTSSDDVLQELYALHDEAKSVLDYFGRDEYSPEVVAPLAHFMENVRDFAWDYGERLETNQTLISKLDKFLAKVPESLWEVADALDDDATAEK